MKYNNERVILTSFVRVRCVTIAFIRLFKLFYMYVVYVLK